MPANVLRALWAAALVSAASGASAQLVQVTPGAAGAAASTSDANVAANAVDGDLATRWSGSGDGAWLRLDLGASHDVSRVRIAVHQGDGRRNEFDIQVSADGEAWQTVRSGPSSGTTLQLESYDFPPVSARYVRYLGHGSSAGAWNSVTEMEVWVAAAAPSCAGRFGSGPASQWAFYDSSGRLAYRRLDARGDRILDFSHAGYKGGGVALPRPPARATLSPAAAGDDTARIQAAIDQVAARAPDAAGLRGAVVLRAGSYRLEGTLQIHTSGVVLRGSGSGAGGTVVQLTGGSHPFIRLAGTGSWSRSGAVAITSRYIPSGAATFTVASAAGFSTGDPVIVERPVTADWVHFMGMDTLVRNGRPQTWLGTSTRIRSDRTIQSISGNQVTLDVPLSDSFDAGLLDPPGPTLSRYVFPGRISQVGVEGLRVIAPPGTPASPTSFKLLAIEAVIDGWVEDVFGQNLRSGLSVGETAKRITLDRLTLHHTIPSTTSAKPGDFGVSGTQTLVMRCKSTNAEGVYYALTQSADVGPIVFLDFQATGGIAIEPHQRWATGLLVDRANITGRIDLFNRGILGSGHGWTIGWGVAWNSLADSFHVQRPPGAQNWSIGGRGAIRDDSMPGGDGSTLPRGIFDSHGTPVAPNSLYLAQLCDRLGPQALANIGY